MFDLRRATVFLFERCFSKRLDMLKIGGHDPSLWLMVQKPAGPVPALNSIRHRTVVEKENEFDVFHHKVGTVSPL